MTAIYMILAAICVLGPLVALHEFGHYIVARLCGVKVQTYSIGFGPKLMGWKSRRSGIEYQLAAIPLGGYVKMLDGRNETVPDELKSVAFDQQHPLKKNRHRRSWSRDEFYHCHRAILGAVFISQ